MELKGFIYITKVSLKRRLSHFHVGGRDDRASRDQFTPSKTAALCLDGGVFRVQV